MKAWHRILIGAAIVLGAVILFRELVGKSTVSLFMPAGIIAGAQTRLIELMVALMLVVVIPTFIVLFSVVFRYREENKAEYDPDRTHGFGRELILWAIPATLIAVLATLNWGSAHALDPYQAIPPSSASGKALTVQVVALPWKWLFIYPAEHIATVNYLVFPEQTPIHFDLTADAPMSSFWIPQLGSQIYAMDGMMTQLNLEASTTGKYLGKDTEINGEGYAGMTFTAQSMTLNDFNSWVAQTKAGTTTLDMNAYQILAAPSTDTPPTLYASVDSSLFDGIMMKYMVPSSSATAPMTAPHDVSSSMHM